MSKKEAVKKFALSQNDAYTVSELYFRLTGSRAGARWRTPVHQASESTVRRALNELVKEGRLRAWYPIGHCFDSCRYEKVKEG